MFKRTRHHPKSLEDQGSPTLPTSASWPLIHQKSFPAKRATSPDKRQAAWEKQRKILGSVVVFVCLILAVCIFHRKALPIETSPQISQNPVIAPTPSIMRGWQPPLVDRYILQKLNRLSGENTGEEDWEQLREEGFSYNMSTIPLVDHIPEVSKNVHSSQGSSSSFPVERMFPIGTKFLLPSWVGEQESKARLHLVQLAYLAMLTNRTLVLPNLTKGRMGTCMRSGFDVYYDIQAIVNSVIFTEFVEHLSSIPEALTGSIISVDTKVPAKPLVTLDLPLYQHTKVTMDQFGDPSKAKHNNCLKDKLPALQFRSYSPVWLTPISPQWSKLPASELLGADLVAALNSAELFSAVTRSRMQNTEQTSAVADVLVVEWNLRHPVFASLEELALPYAAKWTQLAGRLSRSINPFIGIHWRIETVRLDVLLSCSKNLIQKLSRLLLEHRDISTVYFATDYPVGDESKPRSGTFDTVHAEQREAIKTFLEAFEVTRELSNITLVRLDDLVLDQALIRKNRNVPPPEDWDLGLFGVVDKLVLTKSPVFLSAGTECGKPSSYTRQIIEARSNPKPEGELGETNGMSDLRNEVDYFGEREPDRIVDTID